MHKLILAVIILILATAAVAQTVDTVHVTDTVVDTAHDTVQDTVIVTPVPDWPNKFYELAEKSIDQKKGMLDSLITIVGVVLTAFAILISVMLYLMQRSREQSAAETRAGSREIQTRLEQAEREVERIVTLRKDASSQLQEVLLTSRTALSTADEEAKAKPEISLEDKIKLIKVADAEKSINEYEELLFLIEAQGIPFEKIPASLHKNVGLNYMRLERWDKAIEELKLYLKDAPTDEELLFQVAYSYGEIGQYEKSLDYWRRCTEANPENDSAFYNWGVDLGKMFEKTDDGKWLEQAFEKYEKATTIEPNHHRAFNNWGNDLGKMFSKTGETKWLEQAFEKFERATTIKPDDHKSFNNWGLALGKMFIRTDEVNWLEKSFEKYKKATTIKPDKHEAFYNWGTTLGRMFEKTGEVKWLEQAFEKYEKATSIKPDKDEAFYNWGTALVRMFYETGDKKCLEQALEKFESALKIKPDKESAFYNLACAHSKLESREEMLKALKETVKLDMKYKKMAREDKDFDKYRNDPDFMALTKED